MQRRVLRFEIPVDDQPHQVAFGQVLMAAPWRQSQRSPAGRVEVWIECLLPDRWPEVEPEHFAELIVVGTAQRIAADAQWVASCLDGALVWHVYYLPRPGDQ